MVLAQAEGTKEQRVSGGSNATNLESSTMTVTDKNPPPPSKSHSVPFGDVFVPHRRKAPLPPPPEENNRAVHRVRLSALEHNYAQVESAAHRQRCSVITVVKADGYGHGAIATALHLADCCGADAFAVATLEEAIALRRGFENNPPGRWCKQLASLFHTGGVDTTNSTTQSTAQISNSPSVERAARVMRPTQIRILVLGPPLGFPRCFDDYFHHGIEVMVSGPEVAAALLHWVADERERKQKMIERAAMESKAQALLAPVLPRSTAGEEKKERERDHTFYLDSSASENYKRPLPHPSSTLGNVSGQDLAREVRTLLISQKVATEAATAAQHEYNARSAPESTSTSPLLSDAESSGNSVASDSQKLWSESSRSTPNMASTATAPTRLAVNAAKPGASTFGGLEVAARSSRARAIAGERQATFQENSSAVKNPEQPPNVTLPVPLAGRKRLRWHAVVDSGMGRLGFKTEALASNEPSGARDSVEILSEMLHAEIHNNAPIEFFGMCTHMADANSTSNYTNSQIARFISLLTRVRAAGILIPTVSTDNSAALLTTNLTHFDPKAILSQAHAPTRGYVRTGGAIYGQRPAFKQLQAVSTLLASVRHVAPLKQGESCGYDRAYIAPYDVRIATLTIGFADGYPRELGNRVGRVQIRGSVFPVVGNVCMDMLMVELGKTGDLSCAGASVLVGDTAVLWGPWDEYDGEGMVRLQDLAGTLKTTQSALTCGLDKIRVKRQFI